ncbi:MAG: hypothetical protein DRH76_00465 [Deltaproteobacteria bacterium]|nr:MAG: hypothetical protein DRH76_00465 [Deltaproteobacteria bacterium]
MVKSAAAAGELTMIKNETLDDGIRLEVIDASRPLVGDRWLVAAVFRLVIPVDAVLPAGGSADPAPEQVRGLIGDPVVFEKRLERTFIDADQREAILQDMVRRYLDGVRAYISRPAFARNYVLKQYAEALERARWYADNSDRPLSTPEAAAV